jgi:hypothetical protein
MDVLHLAPCSRIPIDPDHVRARWNPRGPDSPPNGHDQVFGSGDRTRPGALGGVL